MQFQHIQTSVIHLCNHFARKTGEDNYDESKKYHIHARNRAYVWDEKMETKLLSSMLEGYFIPPITCIVKSNDRCEIIDGGNRITVFTKIIDRIIRSEKDNIPYLTKEEVFKIYTFPIIIIEIRNALSSQIGELFRRLNTNKQATNGQLYYMSSDESPLVSEAMLFMKKYPIRERCINVFSDSFTSDETKNRIMTANIVGIISGTLYGIQYIRQCFDKQLEHVENQTIPINRELFLKRFEVVLQIFEHVIRECPKIKPKQKREHFELGMYIGPIIYDIHMKNIAENATQDDILEKCCDIMNKWSRYIVMAHKNEEVKKLIKIRGFQNMNPDKLSKLSYRIDIFIKENRIVSDEELKTIKHISSTENEDEEFDDELDV